MNKTRKRLARALGLAAVVLLGMERVVAAKPYFLTLVELTRGSKLIVTGTITEIRGSTLLLHPIKFHKGASAAKPLEVELPRQEWEVGIPNYKLKDMVVLFAKSTAAIVVPIAGPQGLVILSKNLPAQYETAVSKILEYDVSASTEQKREHLISMLSGSNPLLKRVAMWDFIFIKPRNERIIGTDVLPILGKIALGPDSALANLATSTIGEIGGPQTIPILEKIVKSTDRNVADTAAIMLRRHGR